MYEFFQKEVTTIKSVAFTVGNTISHKQIASHPQWCDFVRKSAMLFCGSKS